MKLSRPGIGCVVAIAAFDRAWEADGLTRRLKPGRHRFRAVVTDAAGNASEPSVKGFRVVRR